MIYKYSEKAVKDIKYLQISERKGLKKFVESVEKATNIKEISNIIKLKGEEDAYRKKIGNYRIGFLLIKNEVLIVRILKRADIYIKNFHKQNNRI